MAEIITAQTTAGLTSHTLKVITDLRMVNMKMRAGLVLVDGTIQDRLAQAIAAITKIISGDREIPEVIAEEDMVIMGRVIRAGAETGSAAFTTITQKMTFMATAAQVGNMVTNAAAPGIIVMKEDKAPAEEAQAVLASTMVAEITVQVAHRGITKEIHCRVDCREDRHSAIPGFKIVLLFVVGRRSSVTRKPFVKRPYRRRHT